MPFTIHNKTGSCRELEKDADVLCIKWYKASLSTEQDKASPSTEGDLLGHRGGIYMMGAICSVMMAVQHCL